MSSRRCGVLSFTLATVLALGAARADGPPRLYLRTGAGIGYSHYWQIDYADREVEGATLEVPFTVGARVRPWLAVGGTLAIHLHPAHSGTKATGEAVTVTPGAGGYLGPSLVFFAAKVVSFELVVGFGGGGTPHWGGVGLVVAPALIFDVLSRGTSHLAIDVRGLWGQWGSADHSGGVRVFIGGVVGLTYSIH